MANNQQKANNYSSYPETSNANNNWNQTNPQQPIDYSYYYQQSYPNYGAYNAYYNYYGQYPQYQYHPQTYPINSQANQYTQVPPPPPPPPPFPGYNPRLPLNSIPPPPTFRPASIIKSNNSAPPPPPLPDNHVPPPPPPEVTKNTAKAAEIKKYNQMPYVYTKENKNNKGYLNKSAYGNKVPEPRFDFERLSFKTTPGSSEHGNNNKTNDLGIAITLDTEGAHANNDYAAKEANEISNGSKNDSNTEDDMPEALKNWVQGIYEAYPLARTNEMAQQVILSIITKAHQNNSMWTANWNARAIPKAIKKIFEDKDKDKDKKGEKIKAKVKRSKSKSPAIIEEVISSEEAEKRLKRQQRFAQNETVKPPSTSAPVITDQHRLDVIDWDEDTVVGTCTILEKNYYRLTSAPDPSKIRPLEILKKTLKLLVKKWEEEQDYTYICDQFQSVRQDLTVQRIKNNFTVYVYETFSRIALEKKDIGEFNKCQSQLKELYSLGIEGSENEFISYRILYFIYTKSYAEIKKLMAVLTQEQKNDENVQFSINMLHLLIHSNFYTFFKTYSKATKFHKILINFFLDRERYKALEVACKAYQPSLTISFLSDSLGFKSEKKCAEFLDRINIQVTENKIDTKLSRQLVRSALLKITKVDIKGQIN